MTKSGGHSKYVPAPIGMQYLGPSEIAGYMWQDLVPGAVCMKGGGLAGGIRGHPLPGLHF